MIGALEDVPESLRQALAASGDHHLLRSPLRLYELLIELTEVSRRHGGHVLLFSAFTPYPRRHGHSSWMEGLQGHHVKRCAKARGFPNREKVTREPGLPAVEVRRLRQTVIEQRRRPVSHTRRTKGAQPGAWLRRNRRRHE